MFIAANIHIEIFLKQDIMYGIEGTGDLRQTDSAYLQVSWDFVPKMGCVIGLKYATQPNLFLRVMQATRQIEPVLFF